jgi:hypothetical protein
MESEGHEGAGSGGNSDKELIIDFPLVILSAMQYELSVSSMNRCS